MSTDELVTLFAQPALAAPEGVTPDFDNPPNHNSLAWGIITVCTVVATLCMCLRIYVRVWLDRSIRLEDVLMIGAFGSYWGTAYAGYEMIHTPGYFVHQWNLHMGDLVRPLYLILIYGCCYSAVLPLIKTAILLDWCRIFVPVDGAKTPFWWACMAVSALQCLWGLLCVILLNAQCRPHRAIWEFYLPSKCYSLPDVMLCSAAVQVFSDITMFLLPQRMIWGLQMSWQKKMGISVIFGAGILASIAACFRLAHTVSFAKTADQMYMIAPLLFWAFAEMACGFFIFSMPCLSKLLMDSGLRRKLKISDYWRSRTRSTIQNPQFRPAAAGQQVAKAWRTSESSYSRLEEGEIALTSPVKDQHNSIQVLQRTDVTVTSTPSPSSETALADSLGKWKHSQA
ncbi:uncharacterized protein BO95DRAFT_431040 [Aspergillus brunneoviolaceus CBS 621.78]|uniref:Rhodopsin domain-containing protein n=2 Tax=Aspergillus TaxID=5052 RepID=A0A8G1RHR7_9EURO|nr:hypothetical protein BO95DRAFT_431040 [Aspergillus brunneoviolaceus CBS 621.78]XP_040796022.1 uncharacterized protein BO72DRAFT_472772 [Aspergillus fijiensis CBS 313.89]RAH46719.1 hypothetical protein BO95DRAFT_431040 [Aspergillus brunneoviolaceus CBS 621.78]RAK72010.1 hypothetical protein BO72DRAFT_472772 [Aspergillus fijiensis CBS 313.89]